MDNELHVVYSSNKAYVVSSISHLRHFDIGGRRRDNHHPSCSLVNAKGIRSLVAAVMPTAQNRIFERYVFLGWSRRRINHIINQ